MKDNTHFKYVNKARAYVNGHIKLLPMRNHWAEVAGVLNAWIMEKDSKIERLKEELEKERRPTKKSKR